MKYELMLYDSNGGLHQTLADVIVYQWRSASNMS